MTIRTERNVFRFFALLLAAACLAAALPVSARAASSADIQKEINALKAENKEIQSQIDAIQSQYNASYDDMASMVAQKNTIDQEMTLLNNKIETTNAQIAAYGQLIADTQDELDRAEEELSALSQQHSARIRAMEEGGGVSYWQVIFEANSFMELLDRITMVEEINASDRRRILEMRTAADLVNASRDGLKREKSSLEETRLQLAEDEKTLEAKRQESDALLYELEQKVDEFQVLLDESEALQEELMQDIAAKEKELKEAKYNEQLAKLALQGQNPLRRQMGHAGLRLYHHQPLRYAHPPHSQDQADAQRHRHGLRPGNPDLCRPGREGDPGLLSGRRRRKLCEH